MAFCVAAFGNFCGNGRVLQSSTFEICKLRAWRLEFTSFFSLGVRKASPLSCCDHYHVDCGVLWAPDSVKYIVKIVVLQCQLEPNLFCQKWKWWLSWLRSEEDVKKWKRKRAHNIVKSELYLWIAKMMSVITLALCNKLVRIHWKGQFPKKIDQKTDENLVLPPHL